MLNWLRFLGILITARFRGPLGSVLDTSVLHLRVGFFDADLSVANNASFLRLMELGRLDLMVRSGFLKHVMREKWSLPLGSAHVLFRRPLRRWQKFTLRTRVLAWRGEWVYVEHVMESRGKVYGKALMKSALIEKGKKVPFESIFEKIGLAASSPKLGTEAELYDQLDQVLRGET